jgi:uncharacterized protein
MEGNFVTRLTSRMIAVTTHYRSCKSQMAVSAIMPTRPTHRLSCAITRTRLSTSGSGPPRKWPSKLNQEIPHPTLAPERVGLFVLLTICGFLIFALTMTFVPVLPVWANFAARVGFLVVFGTLWWVARDGHWLNRFRPVFFAYFTAVFGLSLGFFFADRGLKLLGLTTQTPIGIAAAKFLQASLIVIGILAVAKFSGEDLASLYIRKGRLILGLSVGLVTAAALLTLTMLQPAVRALATPRLMSMAPWILLFVVSNAFMEELLFRGLFLGRYEPLMENGWPFFRQPWPSPWHTCRSPTRGTYGVSCSSLSGSRSPGGG